MLSILARKISSARDLLRAISQGEPGDVIKAAAAGQTKPMTPDAKRSTLLHYARRYHARSFIETGTYFGDTLQYLLDHFDRLASIELSPELFERAQKRFANEPKIELFQGDSATVLPGILDRQTGPALIWLDAHFSGGVTACADEETPIMQELREVFSRPTHRHVILIDDARDFSANPAYPALKIIAEVAEKAGYDYECRFDIIRLVPKS